MTSVNLEDILFTGIITLESGIQLIYFGYRVFNSRDKHKIEYPAVTGNVNFERVYRAQQNTLEMYPVFMTALWTSSLFFHQVPSAIFGALYLYSRHRYFNGYSRSTEGRLPGFIMGFRCVLVMGAMAAVGMLRMGVRMYSGTDIADYIQPLLQACRFR